MRQLDSRALGSFAAASDTGEVTMHSVLDGGDAQPAELRWRSSAWRPGRCHDVALRGGSL